MICAQWPNLRLSKLVSAPPAVMSSRLKEVGGPSAWRDRGWRKGVSEIRHCRQSIREAAMQVPESYLFISGIINVYMKPLIALFINDLWVL